MRMSISEAKAECQRWLDYLASQEARVIELQRLASDRRSGRCDEMEGKRRRSEIQGNGITVYDAAALADAVKVLMNACKS